MIRYPIGITPFGLVLLTACQLGQTPVMGKQVEVQGGAYREISYNLDGGMVAWENAGFDLER